MPSGTHGRLPGCSGAFGGGKNTTARYRTRMVGLLTPIRPFQPDDVCFVSADERARAGRGVSCRPV